jgi:hypothetical protein
MYDILVLFSNFRCAQRRHRFLVCVTIGRWSPTFIRFFEDKVKRPYERFLTTEAFSRPVAIKPSARFISTDRKGILGLFRNSLQIIHAFTAAVNRSL